MRVDLPDPDGPVMATNSPGSTVKSMSWSTCANPASVSKMRWMPRMSMTGLMVTPYSASAEAAPEPTAPSPMLMEPPEMTMISPSATGDRGISGSFSGV